MKTWIFGWVVVVGLWVLTLAAGRPTDWIDVVLGFGTGCMFMAWGLEVTGNKGWWHHSTSDRR